MNDKLIAAPLFLIYIDLLCSNIVLMSGNRSGEVKRQKSFDQRCGIPNATAKNTQKSTTIDSIRLTVSLIISSFYP